MSENKPRKFSCRNCNEPFEAYPPDDMHVFAYVKKPTSGTPIYIEGECENCNAKNGLYWSRYRPSP